MYYLMNYQYILQLSNLDYSGNHKNITLNVYKYMKSDNIYDIENNIKCIVYIAKELQKHKLNI